MDKTLISGLDKGVGRSRPRCRLAAEFLKIESFFFSFSLQKHAKFQNSKNRVFWRPAKSIRRDAVSISRLCFVQNLLNYNCSIEVLSIVNTNDIAKDYRTKEISPITKPNTHLTNH
jgi:hypothetical protein